MRTRLFRPSLTLVAGLLASCIGVASAQDIRVTLLGTGTPAPVMNRFGASILVEAGDQKFLFDAGRGAMQRLTQIGVSWRGVTGVFLTHLHSDHVVGFPDLWLTGWLVGGRQAPLLVWGPRGTKKMMLHLAQAYEFDVAIRQADEHAAAEGARIVAEDVAEGFAYESNGVRITPFDVDHAPVEPAFGYRIDFRGRSVVLSGDTRFSENLIRRAAGVDLLIHEVAASASHRRAGMPPAIVAKITAHHTSPEQAGEVFARVKPKLAVYSHIGHPSATEEDTIAPARKTYAGPLELGEDLMVIEIGDTITVRRPAAPPR